MPNFVIIPLIRTVELDARIMVRIPEAGDRLQLSNGEWLISYNGTTKDLSDHLGISLGESTDSAVVIAAAGYWGKAPSFVWEWFYNHP